MTLEREKIILDADDLAEDWNLAYAITPDRRKALLDDARRHPDSFFNATSETAMTVFMLGRLDKWSQAKLPGDEHPRSRNGWNKAFFSRFAAPWNCSSPRTSTLGTFLAERLGLNHKSVVDSFLLFEVRTFNNAFNGGSTIRNPSFLRVDGEWSRFDALVILPAAETLVFIESKVGADGIHGAAGHDVPQPIRNLETAFFVTTLPESQYEGWSFRYMLLCPKAAGGTIRDFVEGAFEQPLLNYDTLLSTPTAQLHADRGKYRESWMALRDNLPQHFAVVHWDDVLNALCDSGFDPSSYLRNLATIQPSGDELVAATRGRWGIAGIPSH